MSLRDEANSNRIYDPRLGRLMQADPIVQEPTMIGSLNRYSYCMDNPLNATDPSGFNWFSKAWKHLKPFVGAIVAIAMTAFAPAGAGFWYAVLMGAVSGAAGAAANGGNILKGAFIGALSAAAFYGVGEAFAGAKGGGDFLGSGMKAGAFIGKVLAHATVGGVMSVLQGGKFGNGFAAAGVTQAFAGGIDGIGEGGDYFSAGSRALRIAAAAVVGGTTSKMTGGKFSNGAITGAFSRAFNDENHLRQAKEIERKQQILERQQAEVLNDYPELKSLNIKVQYEDFDGATQKFLRSIGWVKNGEADVSSRTIRVNLLEGENISKANILHEMLHIDEAVTKLGGNATDFNYVASKGFGAFDNTHREISSFADRYGQAILHDTAPPSISTLYWRG